LFDCAIVLGWRTDNPARPVKALRTPKGGFQTRQEEQIAAFEAKYAIGTQARLLFDLARYTARRRSDLTVMGPQHVGAGRIRVRQLRTDKTLLIPIHPAPARSITGTPTGHLAFITSNRGAPYTKKASAIGFAAAATKLTCRASASMACARPPRGAWTRSARRTS
jgi:hypothetical protein|tara:strand:- start:173 stop:667 length:495 start_codon:yes stop_codon:yes gene_type:complete